MVFYSIARITNKSYSTIILTIANFNAGHKSSMTASFPIQLASRAQICVTSNEVGFALSHRFTLRSCQRNSNKFDSYQC